MEHDFTILEKLNVLMVILKKINGENEMSFYEHEVQDIFGIMNDLQLESYLGSLASKGRLASGVYAEDGFSAEFKIDVPQPTQIYGELECLISELNKEYITRMFEKETEYQNKIEQYEQDIHVLQNKTHKLENELKEVLTFNPLNLNKNITSALNDINDIKNKVEINKNLSSLKEPIIEIQNYLTNIEVINKNYLEIYKNIIKPIQNESKKSSRLTAIWGIAGIVITTIVSVYITFYTKR